MEQTRRRALGRGLEELFNNEPIEYEQIEEKIQESTPKDAVVEVNISELRSNPYQPRKVFEEAALQELADSIKEHGVFQPVILKKSIRRTKSKSFNYGRKNNYTSYNKRFF